LARRNSRHSWVTSPGTMAKTHGENHGKTMGNSWETHGFMMIYPLVI
jgi:hypothetical protein